ncbi:TPA: hypothetical protein ACH3X2_001470 [Trebouxia sp. C0005]
MMLAMHRHSAGTSSLVEECSTENWNKPMKAQGLSGSVFVALGKFDGMHQGHRLLAQQAASSGASPYLLSFSGMAEVLGWPARLPLVAASDRSRVLASWTSYCCGSTPRQRYIPFAMVRNLSPEAFVQTLVAKLKVSGIVVGQNYRFGYKAAGDSKLLQALGESHGIKVDVVNLVEAGTGGVEGQVSSSKIRHALNCGHMQQVAESLGRRYRLVAEVVSKDMRLVPDGLQDNVLRIPMNLLCNQPPKYGEYQATISMADAMSEGSKLNCSQHGTVLVKDDGVHLCRELGAWATHNITDKHHYLALDFEEPH